MKTLTLTEIWTMIKSSPNLDSNLASAGVSSTPVIYNLHLFVDIIYLYFADSVPVVCLCRPGYPGTSLVNGPITANQSLPSTRELRNVTQIFILLQYRKM